MSYCPVWGILRRYGRRPCSSRLWQGYLNDGVQITALQESSEVYHKLEEWRRERTETPPSYDYLFEKRAVIGSPEQCIAQIKALQEQGIEYFGCNFFMGNIEHRNVLKSMELFAREVMPAFR